MVDQNIISDVFDMQEESNSVNGLLNFLTVCVNYSDYLEHTLKYNHTLFDTIYVISTEKDTLTQNLCKQYKNIHIILTDIFYYDNAPFNKGAAINYAFNFVSKQNWLLVGDSDCVFPRNIRDDIKNLNTSNLYTYKRSTADNKQHLDDIMSGKSTAGALPNRHSEIVLGYCQLFNFNSKYIPSNPFYPTHFRDAGRSDTAFSRLWPRKHRIVLNSGEVIHLGKMSTNWRGRKTPPWI